MDAITDPAVDKVTVMKSARIGWTKMLDFTIGYHVHQDPCSMLLVQPTENDAKDYSKDELGPMIIDTPVLREMFYTVKTRSAKSTNIKKYFPGGILHMVGATTPRSFRRITTRINLYDELDGWPLTTPEGDQEDLAKKRNETAWNRKELAGSTPTIKGVSRIERRFLDSDQRYFFVPCLRCGEFQVLKMPNIRWDKGEYQGAWYECEYCKGRNEGYEKFSMVSAGQWRATRPFRGHAGFHIWSGYSLSPNTEWATLAEEFDRVRKEPEKLKTFVNTTLGETWEIREEIISIDPYLGRKENYTIIPAGAFILIASVDVQDDRLEILLRAYGREKESWGISHHVLFGNTAAIAIWRSLDEYLRQPFRHESGAEMFVDLTFVDAGFLQPMVTEFTKPRYPKVWACKGNKYPMKTLWEKAKTKKYPSIMINTYDSKNLLMGKLKITQPGPKFLHFNQDFSEDYFRQLLQSEHIVKDKSGYFRWQKVTPSTANEALDLESMNQVAFEWFIANYPKKVTERTEGNFEIKRPEPEKLIDHALVIPAPQKKQTRPVQRGRDWITGWR